MGFGIACAVPEGVRENLALARMATRRTPEKRKRQLALSIYLWNEKDCFRGAIDTALRAIPGGAVPSRIGAFDPGSLFAKHFL
jgi:hypothetical protein